LKIFDKAQKSGILLERIEARRFCVTVRNDTTQGRRKILSAKKVTDMIRAMEAEPPVPTLGAYIEGLWQESALPKEEFFALSGISPGYGYEILRNKKKPSRDTLLRIAFVLGLSVDQVNYLLKIGEKATLTSLIKRDWYIMFALKNSMSLIEYNIMADEQGVLPIEAKEK
jgi:transcriptional regulator with XRE-family HTH domain